MSEVASKTVKSGAWLIEETDPAAVFVPEHMAEDEQQLGAVAEKFVVERVWPQREAIERQEPGVHKKLLQEAGELGFFMADVPEEIGGAGLSKKACMRLAEKLGLAGSCAPAFIVQAGIGGLPVVYFGTPRQREKYLEGIMAGTIGTAYALTETNSGSDALAAKASARYDAARKCYVLNGTKQFITNAGFADLFIVFAKVDGDKFTCFIVENGFPGVSTGPEEHKMGLKGSSTRQLVLQDVPVPEENVLGEIGKGHRIAFNVLNIGRLKLAPAVVGGAKVSLREGMQYAKERKQFGQALASFPLIQHKLAGAAVRIYCAESMVYRTADLIDQAIAGIRAGGEPDAARAAVLALAELSVECSINKVFGSEVVDWVVDEMLQVYGGYGYVQDYPAEGRYRDARINRIWEGTSEINRMLITGTLLERAMKGSIPLLPAVKKIADDLMARRGLEEAPGGPLGPEQAAVANAKRMALFSAGAAAQRYATDLDQQQEILAWVADMLIWSFAMESALLRTLRLAGERTEPEMAARIAAVRMAVEIGSEQVENAARLVLAATAGGDELRSMLSMLKKLSRREPVDLAAAGRTVARYVMERDGYPFA
ncbi:MAG: acyl-CoA dehydrogenase [Planctomycetota bacterium]|nr:MAG: acyl-CoA dehydrogenase [Planctomycetota bacterium]